ncbi:hypothetical protein X797_002269 [Metarhizium robertsii]|uniref:Uncharacterized protein n=1 Tax=Metarhizium robertsii TaxID=568076 RepID=A0A0A1V4V1_9HYPO|nr:hypothetical protein X797_002269 [Metarhizium robertsii]
MGSSDIPPPTAPGWLIPASSALLSAGVVFWLICYVLMTKRSLSTRDTPIPLLALGINLSWEIVYAFYVTEEWLEFAGFVMWLALDMPVLYTTLRYGRRSNAASPLVARHVPLLLGLVFVFGLIWKGLEARDTTELAWWSAGVAQMIMSVGALGMLLQRGHSGGQSYAIWFTRFLGTQLGLPGTCVLLWWFWPEAHGFVFHPISVIIVGTSLLCDLAYPFLLAHVRATERVLPDGTIVAGDSDIKHRKSQ